jgi:hypothetical protein
MREIKKRTVRAAVCATLLSGWAATAAADDVNVSFSGYGTLGGTFTSDSKYSYYHDATEFTGASNQFDVGLESRIGLQAVVDFGSGFSVTAQELAKQRGADQFSLGTEWLYLQYAPESDWKIRLGRVVQPTFLLSDSRNVGYAAPWFRAPNEVYGAEPFQHMDGGQALWHHNYGALGVGLVVGYGNTQEQFQSQGTVTPVKVRDTYHTVVTLDYGNLTFRVARTIEDVPEAYPVTFTLKDQFLSTGLQYDDGKAIVMTEWSKRTENDPPGFSKPTTSSTQWYAAGGWRFGKLTPLLMYGNFKQQQSLFFQEGSWGSWSGSLRYDVAHNVALKAQVSRAPAGSSNFWVVPNPASSEHVNVYSVGADFVF